MKKLFFTVTLLVITTFFSQISYAIVAKAPENLIFSGKITKINLTKRTVFISKKKFYFEKRMLKELKIFKRLKKTITVRCIKKGEKYFIEKIIFQKLPVNKKGRY